MRRSTVTLVTASIAIVMTGCGGDDAQQPAVSDADSSSTSAAPSTESESPQPTSAPPVDPLVVDQALTRSLYYDYSQSSQGGLGDFAASMSANQHPDHAYSVAECEAVLRGQGLTDSFTVSAVPDVAAMALDPGWALPAGRYEGLVPSGRTYIVPLEVSQTDPSIGLAESRTEQVHVTILKDRAYFFQDCDLPSS